jgi:hypothetical protein
MATFVAVPVVPQICRLDRKEEEEDVLIGVR